MCYVICLLCLLELCRLACRNVNWKLKSAENDGLLTVWALNLVVQIMPYSPEAPGGGSQSFISNHMCTRLRVWEAPGGDHCISHFIYDWWGKMEICVEKNRGSFLQVIWVGNFLFGSPEFHLHYLFITLKDWWFISCTKFFSDWHYFWQLAGALASTGAPQPRPVIPYPVGMTWKLGNRTFLKFRTFMIYEYAPNWHIDIIECSNIGKHSLQITFLHFCKKILASNYLLTNVNSSCPINIEGWDYWSSVCC